MHTSGAFYREKILLMIVVADLTPSQDNKVYWSAAIRNYRNIVQVFWDSWTSQRHYVCQYHCK